MSIRFASDTVPVTGRASAGVKCIKLDDGDGVIFAGHVPEEGELLVATDRGYMKRSFIFDHEIQGRNGKGLQCFGFKKNGSNGNAYCRRNACYRSALTLQQFKKTERKPCSTRRKFELNRVRGQGAAHGYGSYG